MTSKRIIAFVFLLASGLIAQAHEFWMEPVKFFLKPGEELVVSFKVGENFLGEKWKLTKDRLARVELHHKNTMKPLQDVVTEGETENVKTSIGNEGTHLLVMQSTNAFIDLEAEKFNAYLKEDELDDAYAHRKKTNTLDKNGTELYARCTKLLVQVGSKPDNTFRKEVGLPLEIIPEQNPYTLKYGDRIQFKILFQGKPLFGAKVRVWNYYNNRTSVQNVYSQQDGMISSIISAPGPWMVSVVKMVPSKDSKADWQSYWGSLVFGIRE